jgi:hypothetical protein
MIYKFKSKATGDLIMLGPLGDRLLRLLGREPAAKGIIEVRDMALARQRIERGIAEAEAARRTRAEGGQMDDQTDGQADDGDDPAIGLRQRLWPFVKMLQAAEKAGEPIVWGV